MPPQRPDLASAVSDTQRPLTNPNSAPAPANANLRPRPPTPICPNTPWLVHQPDRITPKTHRHAPTSSNALQRLPKPTYTPQHSHAGSNTHPRSTTPLTPTKVHHQHPVSPSMSPNEPQPAPTPPHAHRRPLPHPHFTQCQPMCPSANHYYRPIASSATRAPRCSVIHPCRQTSPRRGIAGSELS